MYSTLKRSITFIRTRKATPSPAAGQVLAVLLCRGGGGRRFLPWRGGEVLLPWVGVPTLDGRHLPWMGVNPIQGRYPLSQGRYPSNQLDKGTSSPSPLGKMGVPPRLEGWGYPPPSPIWDWDLAGISPPAVDTHVSKHYLLSYFVRGW